MEPQMLNESTQFHTLTKIVQYIVSIILRIKEQPIGYKTLHVAIMEPWKVFISRVMKQPSIRNELLMKVVCLDIKLERWGNNANMVTLTYMQRKVHEHIWVCYPKNIVIYTYLEGYYMYM